MKKLSLPRAFGGAALALLLAASFPARADSTFDLPSATGGGTVTEYTWAAPVLTVNAGAHITITGAVSDGTRIEVASGASEITLNDVSITGLGDNQSPLVLDAGANLTLHIEGTNTLTAGNWTALDAHSAGIEAPSGTTLKIDGAGALTATGSQYGAGIGGRYAIGNYDAGAITISGGTVTANGGDQCAGIGGGYYGTGGSIVIDGGTVTANGGAGGAGIGGGSIGNGGSVTINGGTVTATGGSGGAGIGSGGNGNGGSVTINGGTVTATGSDSGAGIGGGGNYSPWGITGTGGDIVITGNANVTAQGGDAFDGGGYGRGAGAGIGSGGTDAATPIAQGAITINTTGTVSATGGSADGAYDAGENIGQGGSLSSPAINSVAVSITAPVDGSAPSAAATPASGSHFTASPVTWSPADNPFKAGTSYTATVTLTADAGYIFGGLSGAGATRNVNGQPASSVNVSAAGDTVTLTYVFAPLAPRGLGGDGVASVPALGDMSLALLIGLLLVAGASASLRRRG